MPLLAGDRHNSHGHGQLGQLGMSGNLPPVLGDHRCHMSTAKSESYEAPDYCGTLKQPKFS